VVSQSRAAETWRNRQRRRILNREFVTSPAYAELMMRHYDDAVDGPDSAELRTPNFVYRHFRKRGVLGAWRWLGLYERRERVARYVFSPELTGLDVGGARGPISLSVDLCDRLPRDIFNRPVRYRDLDEVADDSLDYVWSSHTLEHIPDIDDFVARLSGKLKPGGMLMALVPAYTCRRWRSGVHAYADEGGDSSHLYTFALARDEGAAGLPGYRAIDALIGEHLGVEEAEMVGDNSIFVVATR
jgi:SAM-dependent methyltransferase